MEMAKYVWGMRTNYIKTECKKSCTTIEYTSALTSKIKSPMGDTVIIYIDSTVTEWDSIFTATPLSVLDTLGSSLGLWLGLGIIQVAKEVGTLLRKIKAKNEKTSKLQVLACCLYF